MAYPYSKYETLADGAVHAAGLLLAIPACMTLMGLAAEKSQAELTATALYATCLLFGFGASALYHMCPLDRIRPILHRIDHAAIYLKIAGSYTPIVVVIGSSFAYGVLGLVWAMAVLGAIAKLSFWRTDAKGSLAVYLLMGWLSALLIWPMWQQLNGVVVALVVIGGLTYCAGTRVYAHPGMPYQNAIWHGFVLVASTCLFGAITLSL
ncbi:MAG: hemolysin III family protein [Sulfitobacter sp.]